MTNLKFILFLFIIIIIISCKKSNNSQIDPELGIDYVQAELIYTNIFQTVSNAIQYDTLAKKVSHDTIFSCMQISFTPRGNTYPKTVTIVFDSICNKGSVFYDGATYSGKITAQLSGPFKTAGTVVNITPVDLYVNANKVTGQNTITTLTRNANGNLMFRMLINNAIIYTKNGNILYTSDKTWTWTQGELTAYPVIYDDIYHVIGTATGINIDNNSFSVQTLNALTIQSGCHWKIVKGKMQVIPANAQTMTVDYGDSICKNYANLLIGNHNPISITF